MRRIGFSLVALALVAAACASGDDDGAESTDASSEPTSSAVEDTSPEDTSVAVTTAPLSTEPPGPPTETRLVVTGPEEIVFDWTTDRCGDRDIPDIATRVVRNADGLVQLYISNETTYRMTGPDLDSVAIDCSVPAFTSSYDPDPARFDDASWISTTYTEDGQTVYGIVHNEYLGATHPEVLPGACPEGAFFDCIDVSLTMVVSTDGGATFAEVAEPANHLVATMPYVYNGAADSATGLWQTSNIVRHADGLYYMLVNIATSPETGRDGGVNWVCAMRTADVSDPTSWRYWDGAEFAGQFVNPYTEDASDVDVCAPVDFPALSGEMSESIVWVESIEKYVIVGGTHEQGAQTTWGTYYSTSTDLIDWSPRILLRENPLPRTVAEQENLTFVAYPTLIDPDSESLNFDTSDGSLYLYFTRFNEGSSSLDRDLLRVPVAFEEVVYEPTVWEFDTDGDAEGWQPLVDIADADVTDGALSMTSTGNDPYLVNHALRIPAPFDTVTITMTADGGPATGTMFFWTDGIEMFDEDRFVAFDVTGDGEPETIELDMSTVDTWDGFITALRIDPVDTGDTTITIESITVD